MLPRHVVTCCLLLAAGCGREFEGAGDLRAQRVVLEREVEGQRDVVARLERGEPILPANDTSAPSQMACSVMVRSPTLIPRATGLPLTIGRDRRRGLARRPAPAKKAGPGV